MADNPETVSKRSENAGRAQAKVTWDDSKMRSSYANVVNAASTREEVTLFFGTNRTWNPAKGNAVEVELTERIIMSPYAAKRLMLLLNGVIKEHESRYGQVFVGVPKSADQSTAEQAEPPPPQPPEAG
jgi:hypothetical protein